MGGRRAVQAVIDTGFSATLALPPGLIAALGLAWDGQEEAALADGSVKLFDYYRAVVHWDGSPWRVAVLAAGSDPLVGMELLAGYELSIQVTHDGIVTIVRL